MRAGCILPIALLGAAGLFLFMFANPVGWIVAAVFAIAAGIATLVMSIDRRSLGLTSPNVKQHGEEDRRRGPNDDPMLR